jgi:hypothetical protein
MPLFKVWNKSRDVFISKTKQDCEKSKKKQHDINLMVPLLM